MRSKYLPACALAASCAAHALAQEPLTPPIQPKLAPVTTPPAITVPVPPGGPQPAPINANEAAEIALKHQPQIAIARAAILSAHGNVLQAAQLLLPNVTLNAAYGQSYSLPFVGTPSSVGLLAQGFTAGATASQLIFDFGKTLDQVRSYESQEKAAGFNLTTTESDTVYTVKQDFYTFVQDLQTVDVASSNLKDTQDNLALAQARLNAGIGEPGDVVTAQTNLAAATVALITDRNAASTAEVALALEMGIDPRTPIVPKDSMEKVIPIDDMNGLVDQGLKQRPEIKQQQELLRSAGYQVSVARKSLLPSVSVAASTASISGSSYDLPKTWAVGIELTWTPFNFASAKGQVDVANASAQTAKANLLLESQTVISDISTAYLNIRSAELRLATSQAEVANGLEGLRIAEGQYKAGVTTFVTVTNAEYNLAQARNDFVTSTAALQLARAAMEHALGKPL